MEVCNRHLCALCNKPKIRRLDDCFGCVNCGNVYDSTDELPRCEGIIEEGICMTCREPKLIEAQEIRIA